jgi:hypothetical protein
VGRPRPPGTVPELSEVSSAHHAAGAVLDLASEFIGVSPLRARRLRETRSDGLDGVLLAARRLGAELRGSWRWGDFHLDERSGRSCSDLDLLGRRPPIERHVATPSGRLRVAVHAVDYEPMISIRVSCSFALVNLASARLTPGVDPYILAKCQLMLARESVDERYADVAVRIGGATGAGLLARKLGIDQARQPAWARDFPVATPPTALTVVLEQLLHGPPARRELESLRSYIEDELSELDRRHRHYVAGKVGQIIARVS